MTMRKPKKLTLRRETIATLQSEMLDHVLGGTGIPCRVSAAICTTIASHPIIGCGDRPKPPGQPPRPGGSTGTVCTGCVP